MTNKTKRVLGFILVVCGLILLIFKAVDYLTQANQISSGVSAIGLVLVAIGAGLTRHKEEAL